MAEEQIPVQVVDGTDGPPAAATDAYTSRIYELFVISFGYINPVEAGRRPAGHAIKSTVFAQYALPREAFGRWLRETLGLLGTLPAEEIEAMGLSKVLVPPKG